MKRSNRSKIHRAQAEELHRRDQQLLHEQSLAQNRDLREAHTKSLNEMEELKRVQEFRVDDARQLGCVFQDMEPPKLTPILRKSSDMQKPIQRVQFTKAVVRHTKIRGQNLRSDTFAQVYLISVSPTLQNLRVGLRKRQSGKSKVPVKHRGGWPKVF